MIHRNLPYRFLRGQLLKQPKKGLCFSNPRSPCFFFLGPPNRRLEFQQVYIQLFREKLSEKVHATIPKGIVGGFKFTILERNLKELVRKAVEMCLRVLKESNKSRFDR